MKKFHTKNFLRSFSVTIYSVIALAMIGLLSSCQSEEDLSISKTRSTYLEFNITMPLSNVIAGEGYENGSLEENLISDYRVYFYDTNNKYIMSLDLNNVTFTKSDEDLNTVYTITAQLMNEDGINPLEEYPNFKIVMLANWETYVEPTVGSTIDDLCESANAQYTAFTSSSDFNLATSGKHIPFYGVHEYTGVIFPKDGTKYLTESLSLLRAMAKLEVIIDCEDDDNDYIKLGSAQIHNFNRYGYCAPANVYSQSDYGKGYDWASDYTGENIHLVGGQNNSYGNVNLYKVQDKKRDARGNVTQKETWIAYVPEFDNKTTNYSYIDLRLSYQPDTPYLIYFAVYDDDGKTKAYDEDATADELAKRRDIHRNNLYRFNVLDIGTGLRVKVVDWEQAFDNEWVFGNMEGTGVILPMGSTFAIGIYEYEVIGVDPDNPQVEITYNTSSEGSVSNYQGDIVIPEVVSYDGVAYTVVAINEETFYYGQGITSVSVPATVTKIGYRAFYECENMETFTIYAEVPPTCESEVFSSADTDRCILYVPKGCVDIYKSTSPWSSFTNIQEIVE